MFGSNSSDFPEYQAGTEVQEDHLYNTDDDTYPDGDEEFQHRPQPRHLPKKDKKVARKSIKNWIKSEFAIGFLEGAAAGLVLGLCTGGIGFIAIPLFAVLRGLHRANKAKNYTDIADRIMEYKNPQTASTITANLAKGAVLGAGAGALFGLFLAPFTFGLSIPICAAIGAGCGLISAAINEVDNTRSNISLITNNQSAPSIERQARESAEVGVLAGAAIGLGLAPFTLGISLIVGPIIGGLIGYGISKATEPSLPQKAQKIRYATYGGAATGAAAGGLIGAFLSPITFGLSIPICALIGAAVGAFLCRQGAKTECCRSSESDHSITVSITRSSTKYIGGNVGGIRRQHTASQSTHDQHQGHSRQKHNYEIRNSQDGSVRRPGSVGMNFSHSDSF